VSPSYLASTELQHIFCGCLRILITLCDLNSERRDHSPKCRSPAAMGRVNEQTWPGQTALQSTRPLLYQRAAIIAHCIRAACALPLRACRECCAFRLAIVVVTLLHSSQLSSQPLCEFTKHYPGTASYPMALTRTHQIQHRSRVTGHE
jgi:hypothetical protein